MDMDKNEIQPFKYFRLVCKIKCLLTETIESYFVPLLLELCLLLQLLRVEPEESCMAWLYKQRRSRFSASHSPGPTDVVCCQQPNVSVNREKKPCVSSDQVDCTEVLSLDV